MRGERGLGACCAAFRGGEGGGELADLADIEPGRVVDEHRRQGLLPAFHRGGQVRLPAAPDVHIAQEVLAAVRVLLLGLLPVVRVMG